MSPVHKIIQILEIDGFEDPDGFALRFNGKRIFVNKWNKGTSFVKEISQEELWQTVGLLKDETGLISSNSIDGFLMIKYIEPFVIRINFPPTSNDFYIDIYKVGQRGNTDPRISELWTDKAAYNWLRDFIVEIPFISLP